MTGLLSRLKSKPKPAPFALDALDLAVLRQYANGFTMTRAKGMELPGQWDTTWRLVENSYLKEGEHSTINDKLRIFRFVLTPKGKDALNTETTNV